MVQLQLTQLDLIRMNNKQVKFMLLFVMVVFFTGCSSTDNNDDIKKLSISLNRQAALINQHLPDSNKGVILVRASVEGRALILNMYQNTNEVSAMTFLNAYAVRLCQQSEIRQRLLEGASYQLIIISIDRTAVKKNIPSCDPPQK